MKNLEKNKAGIVCLFILLLVSFFSSAQLTTSGALTPAQLVQNILIGNGVTVSNIVYNGATQAIGSFNGANSNLNLPSGMMMCSGDIVNAPGPNNTGWISTANGLAGDGDLDLIMAPTLSYDVSILEFDFTATTDTVKFRYVFGSDEYMEYVSSSPGGINDGFGFFISGPGISGPFSNNSINIALIPGTTLPVTMFNLNLNNNGSYYFDNGNGSGTGTASDGLTVQYDGFTIPMTAITAVQCGQTYHIKIAIADGGDGILDSGVFLEAGSFAGTGNVIVSPSTYFGGAVGGNDTTIYEGCGYASVLFKRGASNLANADTIIISYSGSAENGLDFAFLNDTVYYAPGQDSAFLTVNSIADMLIEGTESIVFTIYTSTSCGGMDTLSLTMYIVDSPPLSLAMSNDTIVNCPAQSVTLTGTANGGVAIGNYHYFWTNSTSTAYNAIVNPSVTTTYKLLVSDSCGNTINDSVTVFIPYLPLQLTLNNDTSICSGNPVVLNADVKNGLTNYIYSWTPNITTLNSVTVQPLSSASYQLTVTDACGLTTSGTVDITIDSINADFAYFFPSNQTVQFENKSIGGVQFLWNFGDDSQDSTSSLENPQHFYSNDGTYLVSLIITNMDGCTDTTYQTIIVLPDFTFFFPNSFSPDNDANNDLFMGYGKGIQSYHMRIFDRWGEKIFETFDQYTGWDGTYKGIKVSPGVYVCVFDIVGDRSQKIKRMGSVTLTGH